jgi:peptidoglycan/LPS O-acetylase OafA/YrhL
MNDVEIGPVLPRTEYSKLSATGDLAVIEDQKIIDQQVERIETVALTGLRGTCILHVALSHYALFCGYYIQGNFSVVCFLLLSGYILTIGYARKDLSTTDSLVKFRDYFYTKRLVRLLPVYYAALLYSLYALIGLDQVSIIVSVVLSLTMTTSWVGIYPWCGVGWTLSMLIFFYLLFPYLLKFVKQHKDRKARVIWCYYIQIITYYVMFAVGVVLLILGWPDDPHLFARSFPATRIPLFMMAMYMALDRILPNPDDAHDPSRGNCCKRNESDCCCLSDQVHGVETNSFSGQCVILGIIGLVIVICSAPANLSGMLLSIIAEPWMAYLYLLLIHSLTSEGGSKTYFAQTFLGNSFLQWMGTISYSFYMTHLLTGTFFLWIVFGFHKLKNSWLYGGSELYPGWVFIPMLCFAVGVGAVFYYFIERPTRTNFLQLCGINPSEIPPIIVE